MTTPALSAVLLAAGASTRMGRPKPLLDFGGDPLVVRHARALLAAGVADVAVITGAHADLIRAALAPFPVRCVHNADHAAGMLASLQCGLRALARDAVGVLVHLVDQPPLRPDTLPALVGAFSAALPPLLIPTHHDRRGHPLVLRADLIHEALALRPPDTLRTLVHRHLAGAVLVPVADPAVTANLNTPEDYTAWAPTMA